MNVDFFLPNADVVLFNDFVILAGDLVPLDFHEPNATSHCCLSDCDFVFKQKNCSPGMIKSKRRGSLECAKWNFLIDVIQKKIETIFYLLLHKQRPNMILYSLHELIHLIYNMKECLFHLKQNNVVATLFMSKEKGI